jgi:hypothetical protein
VNWEPMTEKDDSILTFEKAFVFAPAERDVYSHWFLSLLRSSVGAQSALPEKDEPRFRSYRSEVFYGALVAIYISLR